MATVTLAESAKLAQEELVAGVIESIVTVNMFFELFPFDGINGNAVQYNREGALGPVAALGVGNTDGAIGVSGTGTAEQQAAKDAATFVEVTANLITIAGDAEVNGLIQSTRSSDGNDQTETQIASKAKSAGRKYQDMMINGDGTNFSFPGMLSLCAAQQTVAATAADGDALSFATVDELIDLVKDKDGQVDYLMMQRRELRAWKALLRGLGGAAINEVVELPTGNTVMSYGDIPMFGNDYIPINQTQGMSTDATTLFAGTIDDGSRQHGLSGLTAEMAAGVSVVDVGESETKDERIWRVRWYCGMALWSELGLACATGIIP